MEVAGDKTVRRYVNVPRRPPTRSRFSMPRNGKTTSRRKEEKSKRNRLRKKKTRERAKDGRPRPIKSSEGQRGDISRVVRPRTKSTPSSLGPWVSERVD